MKTPKTTPAQPVDLPRLVRRSCDSVLMWCVKPLKSPILTETLRTTPGLCAMDFELKVGGEVWKAMQGDGARVVAVEVTPLNLEKERRKPPVAPPNATAQQRDTNDEPSRENATGALAAAPCSAIAGSLGDMVKAYADCGVTLTLKAQNVDGVNWVNLGAVKAIGGGVCVSA